MADTISQAKLTQFSNGLSQALTKIDANVASQVMAESMPILGDNLKDLATSGTAQLHYAANLGAAVKAGLESLSGSPNYTSAQVQTAINSALASAGFDGVGVAADFSQAGDLKLAFTTEDTATPVAVAVDENLGLGKLDLATAGNAQVTLDTALNFSAGIDANGFYLDTGDTTEFSIGVTARMPGFTAAAEMGGIAVTARDTGATNFTGDFAVDLKDGNADGKLRLAELNGDLLDASLTGDARVALNLATNVPAGTIMPNISTLLDVSWNFDEATVNPTDDNSDFGDAPTVAFNNTSINLGSFFDGMAGTVLAKIGELTAPMMPIIDFLTTPIPLLSDLGSSKVTLLDFMGLTPDQSAAIQGLADIASLADKLSSFANANLINISLGSASVTGDIRVDDTADLIAQTIDAEDLGIQNADLKSFLEFASDIAGGGLDFPVLNDVGAIGNMFLGGNVDLFSYDTSFGFDYAFKQFFPVLGPVGVTLGGKFGLEAKFDFGFDTEGLRDYVDSGMTDPTKIFDGFYIQATDEDGKAVTGFQLTAGIIAGLAASIGIAEIGVEGDITANIDFGLNPALDPLGTGKIRGSILAITDIADLFDPTGAITAGLRAYLEIGFSPFSIEFSFDSPRITLLDFDGDRSRVAVLGTPQGNGDLLLNIGDRSALRVFGNLADGAEKITIAYATDLLGNEVTDKIAITGFGTTQLLNLPGKIIGNGGNSADDIVMNERVNVAASFSGGLGRDILTSGAGRDTLAGDEGADVLSGNGGRDILRGGAGQDKLIGGAGADTIDGGDGQDTASYATAKSGMTIDLRTATFTGDGLGDVFTDVERYEATNFADLITGSAASNELLAGLDGNDTINGLGGDDLLTGGNGVDSLNGGLGNDMLIGGAGADTLEGGDGVDTLSYVTSQAPVIVNLRTGRGTGGDATGDVTTGFENLIGTALPFGDLGERFTGPLGTPQTIGTGDILIGSDGDNLIAGLAGADSIDGAAGNDILYGNAKDETISSNPPATQEQMNAFEADTIKGGFGSDTLFGQTGDDLLDGGNGRDRVLGGDGDDHLFTLDTGSSDTLDGGSGTNRLSADYSDKTVSINWILGQNNDFTFADGDSQRNFTNVGELDTGSARDVIRLDGSLDDGYNNIIRTNGGNDLVYTGRGGDLIEGGANDDRLYSGDGADRIDGGAGADFVNGGSNTVKFKLGGFGVIIGVESGSGDTLAGGLGVDTVSFENTPNFIGDIPVGVTVDLLTNETGGAATGTVISGFENVVGTNFGDDLKGDDGDNIFSPLRGGGQFSASTGGPDRIDGRGGVDTLIIDFSLADIADSRGVYTNGTSIYRLDINATKNYDSYIYTNIEQLRITGASKADTLYSWSQGQNNDYLNGLAGNDTLGGKGGADTLLGGDGNDSISAQGTFAFEYTGIADGADVINGGAGDDWIEDVAFGPYLPLLGATALFKLDGGTGFDTLSVDFSNQTANMRWNDATPGNFAFADGAFARNFERLRIVATGSGDDALIQSGRFYNQFYLGAGDDTANAGLGLDTVDGGEGNDLLILDASTGDVADLSGLQGGGFGNVFTRRTPDFNTYDNLAYRNIERMLVTGTAKDDNFGTSIGSDTLYGGDGNDTLNSLDGGDDYIDGGTGNDVLIGSGGLYGGTGADSIFGGTGNDSIRGLAGNDSILGGLGNDTISTDYSATSAYGTDQLFGGAGDDSLSIIELRTAFTYALPTDLLRLDGGAGNDTMSADFGDQTVGITFRNGVSNAQTFANGSYFRDFEAVANLFTGDGADLVIQATRLSNTIATRGGDDTVNAGVGFDTLYGGTGNDLLILDYSIGDAANVGGVIVSGAPYYQRYDTVTNTVIDQIYAPEFERIQLTGGSKSDVLVGFAGDDTITGGSGADTLRGGTGLDRLDGGAGFDTADFRDIFQSIIVRLDGANVATVKINGVVQDTVRNIENITGGSSTDQLTGDAGRNILSGGFSNDTLRGLGGADQFVFATQPRDIDFIADFDGREDSIVISAQAFGGGLVAGEAARLTTTNTFATVQAGDGARFIYDRAGADAGLYFDATGGSGADAILFAKLTGLPPLVASDILIAVVV